jgi:putative transposase
MGRSSLTRGSCARKNGAWPAQLLRLIGEKAEHYGRTFPRIGRFVPTSQTCSECGTTDGPKPLSVRTWTCAACGRCTTGT